MEPIRTRLNRYLDDRFDLLVVACLVDYVLLVTVHSSRYQGLGVVLPVVTTVLIAQSTTNRRSWIRGFGAITGVLGTLVAIAAALHTSPQLSGTVAVLFALALLSSFLVAIERVIRSTGNSTQSMFAALSAYLLVGLFFSLTDFAFGTWLGEFFTQPGLHPESDYAYFSFVTMTTVGYGDLTPLAGLPRSLAVLEAVTGQMVLVTLVARTVASASGPRRVRKQDSDD